MPRWTVSDPTTLDFDGVAALQVRVISGSVAVLSTSGRPSLDVASVTGQPLTVTHQAGILTITYPDLTWEGLLGWLHPTAHEAAITVAVPGDCPAQIGVVNASATVSGISARTSVKSLSGSITLDGVAGTVDADTLSGSVDINGLAGRLAFKSVSGDLTLADGSVDRLDAKTVSGRVTADVDLAHRGALRVATVSGAVTIRLPSCASARVDLRSTTGRLQSEFPGLAAAGNPGAATLAGTLGSGDGRLSVTTMSGQVTLLERGHRARPRPAGPAQTDGDA